MFCKMVTAKKPIVNYLLGRLHIKLVISKIAYSYNQYVESFCIIKYSGAY